MMKIVNVSWVWRSLVARLNGVQEAAGSIPVTQTRYCLNTNHFPLIMCIVFIPIALGFLWNFNFFQNFYLLHNLSILKKAFVSLPLTNILVIRYKKEVIYYFNVRNKYKTAYNQLIVFNL